MRRVFPAAIAAILGVALGFAVAFIWLRASHTPDNGGEILAKVAKDFVVQRRNRGSGVTFFDQPKPYGDWLCRTNAYYVHEKVITGKIEREQDRWDDDLNVRTVYGIWRAPSLGRAPDEARHKACAGFRDFDHTFIVQHDGDPERGAFLLDSVLTMVHSGQPNLPIACTQPGLRGEPAACDARKVLSALALKDLRQVDAVSEQKIAGGMRRSDLLVLPADPKSPDGTRLIQLTVVSDQRFGKQSASEGTLRSLAISVECFC